MFEKKGMNMYELQNSQNTENTKVYWDSMNEQKSMDVTRPPGIARWFFRSFRRMGLKGFGLAMGWSNIKLHQCEWRKSSNCWDWNHKPPFGMQVYNDLKCDWYDLYIWWTCRNSLEILVWSGQFYMSTAAWRSLEVVFGRSIYLLDYLVTASLLIINHPIFWLKWPWHKKILFES